MINPLQAMMAARAANQNTYGAGVQNTGAVDPRVLLAAQQMNTPSIGQRMDARNSEMVKVDPYKYVDLKQQRDYDAAMRARSDNTRMMIANAGALNNKYLADQAYEREKEIADTKYERDQQLLEDADRKARERALDAERRENELYNRRLQEQREAEKMKLALTNDQFASLREPAMKAIQNKTYWNAGGEQETANDIYKSLLSKRALQVGDEAIQNAYKEEFKLENGSYPEAQLQRTDENGNVNPKYQEIANKILMGGKDFVQVNQEIQKEVASQVSNIGQTIDQNFRAVSATMGKFGYSPSEVGDYTPDFSPNALNAPTLTGLPVPPPNMGATGDTSLSEQVNNLMPEEKEDVKILSAEYSELLREAKEAGAKEEQLAELDRGLISKIVMNIHEPLNDTANELGYLAQSKGMGDLNTGQFAFDPDNTLMSNNQSFFGSDRDNALGLKDELQERILILKKLLGKDDGTYSVKENPLLVE